MNGRYFSYHRRLPARFSAVFLSIFRVIPAAGYRIPSPITMGFGPATASPSSSAEEKEGFGNQGVSAPRASARFGQFFPLAEKKAAIPAAGRNHRQLPARAPEAQPEMLQMPVHLPFRDAEPSGKLPGGKGFFFESLTETLTKGCSSFLISHGYPVFPFGGNREPAFPTSGKPYLVSFFSAFPPARIRLSGGIFFPDSREKIW